MGSPRNDPTASTTMKLVFGLASAFLAVAVAIPALRVARDVQPELTLVEVQPEYAVAVEMVEYGPNGEMGDLAVDESEDADVDIDVESDVDSASFYAELYEVEEANYGNEDDCYDEANAEEAEDDGSVLTEPVDNENVIAE